MSKARFLRRTLFAAAVLGVTAAWAAVGAGVLLDAPRSVFLALFVIALLASEGLFWLGAGLLGWKVFEGRRALLARLSGANAKPQEGRP